MQNLNTTVPKNDQYLLNKTYYQINPANKNEYRTITRLWNIYTKSHSHVISNYIVGSPTTDMIPISQFHLSQLMRMKDQIPF